MSKLKENLTRRRPLARPGALLVAFTVCLSWPSDAGAQLRNTAGSGGVEIGVRHAIVASVDPNRDSPVPAADKAGGEPSKAAAPKTDGEASKAEGEEEAPKATVDAAVRILDYAHDYRFYGVVHAKFSDFDPREGAPAEEIWKDPVCHENRGLPKIQVLAISGRITEGETSTEIAALPRHIGEWVPVDEIVMQRDRPAGPNYDPNQSLVMVAKTSQSHLAVKLVLNSTSCGVIHQ